MAKAALAPFEDPFWVALTADVCATVAIYAFSVWHRNSSFYDPFWSVAPIFVVGYWTIFSDSGANPIRQALCLGAIAFWGTRLTTNWATGWGGLQHEDWRYVDLRRRAGVFFPFVDFFGIHMMPTLLVFLALWPAYEAVRTPSPLWVWDLLGAGICILATVLEARSDAQLRGFRQRTRNPERVIDEGLWRWSRHPNYLGEILFWWGLWFMAVGASPANALTCVGAVGIAVLFRFVSIPLMERRMLARRPAYATQIATVPMLLLWPPKPRPPETYPETVGSPPTSPGTDALLNENVRLAIDTMPMIPPPEQEDD